VVAKMANFGVGRMSDDNICHGTVHLNRFPVGEKAYAGSRGLREVGSNTAQ